MPHRPLIRPFTPPLRALRVLAALLLALAVPRGAHAQEMGTLQGVVRDVSGAPVPAAIVEVELEGASFRRGTAADEAGRYRLTALPGGRYRVRVRHPGYATATEVVAVVRGEESARNFTLRVRALVIDTVTVTTNSPAVIRREDTEFSTEVSEAAIALLPLSPDVREVVALTPGARAGQVWGGATQQANNYQIDGLAANHPGVGGDLVQPSINWVESVEVRGLGAAAEFGNFQGGLVNLVTKSGTNDFEGAVRLNVESGALAASNLQQYDVAAEMDSRYDFEAEARGPILRDRLHYYVAGQWVQRADRAVNHLRTREGFFAPGTIDRREQKGFAKLSWQPTSDDQLTVSGGYIGVDVDRLGATGYEDANAFVRGSAPTYFYNGTLRHVLGAGAIAEASLGGFVRDERREPYGGTDVPGVVLFGRGDRPAYNAAPFRYRLAPEAMTGATSLQWEMRTGPLTHRVKLGGELSRGGWTFERLRNGGMTWRPGFGNFYESFDPANTATWRGPLAFVPLSVGGEVRLNADVANGAAFIQDQIDFGSRLSISPGVRFGWWSGYLTPSGGVGPRFRAVDDRAWDARLGVTLDITGRNDLVLKAHAGRYHQSMFAQLYDRAEGGNVFTNEQLWYYFGTPAAPGQVLSETERDALAATGRLVLQEEARMNQTGPAVDYRQPYIDQLVVGVEKQLGRWWKAEMVYVDRRNHNMVALVDRNAATNYTAFDGIQALDSQGKPLFYGGEPVLLPRVYVPNFAVVDQLKIIAASGGFTPLQVPPGLTLEDTLSLTWDPDYVLTNVPQARRTFQQAQFVVRMGHPRYGGLLSFVYSRLRGNLDNVSGYDESSQFAGPFVNPNQATNFYGRLGNSSELEIKVWMYGALGRGFRGGIFWSQARGDRYTPVFTLSSFFAYADTTDRSLDSRLMSPLVGQPVLLRERGFHEYPHRSLVDLHLERPVRMAGAEWTVTVDAFNIFGTATPTRYNTSVNDGPTGAPVGGVVEPESVYGAVRERVRPRSIRLGTTVRF
ncbi:MAG TPA: TonB-dependent receptor [Longimicrobium sp.]